MPLPQFSKYIDDFNLFIQEIVPEFHEGMHLWQINFVKYINDRLKCDEPNTKVSIVGVKSSGKTSILTMFCMFIMLVYDDASVCIAASTKSQTKDVAFRRLKEIFSRTSVMNYVEITDYRCKYILKQHRQLYGSGIETLTLPKHPSFSSSVSGRHGRYEVFFIDEADTAHEEVLKQLFVSYARVKTFHIMSANPEIESPTKQLSYCGRVMTGLEDLENSKYNWAKITIPLDMCDKLDKRVIQQIKDENGYPDISSPTYRRHVLGVYTMASQGELLFPIIDVKESIKIVDELPDFSFMTGGQLGVDIAYGKRRNYSVISYWYGLNIYILFCSNTVSRYNFQTKLLDYYNNIPECLIHIDDGGIGYNVYEELKGIGCRIHPIKAEGQVISKNYANKKTQLYGHLSKLIKARLVKIIIPKENLSAKKNILVEGTTIRTEYSDKGKLKVLSKNRTSHTSPDCIDAISYCFNLLSEEKFPSIFRYMLSKK